ncbi:MAG: hypothetical protein ACW967_08355 [Candidatus Hodarchaeales archaeon]|jgi:hypothetical protein
MGILDIFFKRNVPKNEVQESIPKIQNEHILQELDALGISTKDVLREHNHRLAFSIFCYLFAYDLKLRIKIANHLAPALAGDKELRYTEEDFPNIIELQSYFNNFRVTFLADLTIYFTELYQVATDILEEETDKNITLSTQLFNAAQELDRWYMNQIKEKLAPEENESGEINELHRDLYTQCIDVLDEVKETGFLCFTKVLHANSSKFAKKNIDDKRLKK